MSYSTSMIECGALSFVILAITTIVGFYALYLLIRLSWLAIAALKIYISKNKVEKEGFK